MKEGERALCCKRYTSKKSKSRGKRMNDKVKSDVICKV